MSTALPAPWQPRARALDRDLDRTVALQQQATSRRHLRMSVRGLAFSAAVVAIVLSGALPMAAGTQAVLLAGAGFLAVTRTLRGIWALRVARHRMRGWRRRHLRSVVPTAHAAPPQQDSPSRRAVLALTGAGVDPLVGRARDRALALVDKMEELEALLADDRLAAALRGPVAEALTRSEAELEALLRAVTALDRAEGSQRDDLAAQLSARLEVDQSVRPGLYAAAE